MKRKKSPKKPSSPFIQQAGLFMQKSSKFHLKVSEDMILTTMDKIKLCLLEHLARIENKFLWLTPLSILVTIIVVVPTTSFQAFILPADTWRAFFFLSAILAAFYTYKFYPKGEKGNTISTILEEIQLGAETIDSSDLQEDQEDPGFEIKITSPKNGSKIDGRISVTGTFDCLPESGHLSLFTISSDQKKYWFHSNITQFNESLKTWTGEIIIGGPDQYKNFLVVGILSEDGAKKWEDLKASGILCQEFPKDSFSIPDFLEYDKIEIERGKALTSGSIGN